MSFDILFEPVEVLHEHLGVHGRRRHLRRDDGTNPRAQQRSSRSTESAKPR